MESELTCPTCRRVISDKQGICSECQPPVAAEKKLDGPLFRQLRSKVEKCSFQSYQKARDTFPTVQLDFPAFMGRVADLLDQYVVTPWIANHASQGELEECATCFLDKLKWKELYLTTACASGNESAWELFQSLYADCILKVAYSCSENASDAHELADTLMGDLFLPADSQHSSASSKIAQYHGIGSLEGWLRVIVTRMRIDRVRSSRKQVPLDELPAEPQQPADSFNAAGLVEMKEQQIAVSALTESLESALSLLDDQDKLLIKLYYLQHVSLKELGKLFKVHESTVSRRVEQICRKLQKSVERRLREALHVRPGEIQYIIQAGLSQHEIDLKQILAKSVQLSE